PSPAAEPRPLPAGAGRGRNTAFRGVPGEGSYISLTGNNGDSPASPGLGSVRGARMISVHHWDGTTNTCASGTPDNLPATVAEVAPDDVWWIDLSEPTPEEEELVFGRFFRLHPLTLEDITKPRRDPDQGTHLPKVEEFPDYLFVIVNPLPPGLAEAFKGPPKKLPLPSEIMSRRKHRPQLSAVLGERVLITHHYLPLDCVTQPRTL